MSEVPTDPPDITIAAFPRDDSCWRIDWFGEIAFPDRMVRRRQPSVLVHLSRVVVEDFQERPAVLLNPSSTAPAFRQRKCWISVGAMTLLRVGDIWRNQRPFFAPDYQLECFDLEIDDTKSVLVKAGLSQDGAFLLPLEHHPWHLHNTYAYCVAVTLQDNRKLVVPCMELIRFYFGSSSSLLTHLFTPPLSKDRLIVESEFDASRKHLRLTLAERVPAASAVDIARIATSHRAWWAALQVGTSCLHASTAGGAHGIHPRTGFPFEGATKITAAGKWLPLGDRANATFVVFSLRQCEHPFKFRSLQYRLSDASRPWRRASVTEQTQSTQARRRGARDAQPQPLVESDAGYGLASRNRRVRVLQKFPDLTNKHIWGARKLEAAGASRAGSRSQDGPVPAAALGESGSDMRVRPIALVQALKDERRNHVPTFLRVIVDTLAAMPGIDVRLQTESEIDGWTIPIKPASDDDGVIDEHLFLKQSDGSFGLRRLAAFALEHAEQGRLIVVIEAEPFVAFQYAYRPQDEQGSFTELLEKSASDFLDGQRQRNEVTPANPMPHEASARGLCDLRAWLIQGATLSFEPLVMEEG